MDIAGSSTSVGALGPRGAVASHALPTGIARFTSNDIPQRGPFMPPFDSREGTLLVSRRGRPARSSAALCCILLLAVLPHGPIPASPPSEERIPSTPLVDVESAAITAVLGAHDFTENAGQLSKRDVFFYAGSENVQVGFAQSAILVGVLARMPEPVPIPNGPRSLGSFPHESQRSRGVLVRIAFEGSNPVRPEGAEPLPHRSHYFLGSDPAGWRMDVAHYAQIVYRDLYDGVDVSYQIGREGLKYDITVRPGADPGKIAVLYEGVEGLEAHDGGLVVHAVLGDLSDSIPRSYQG